MVYVGIDVAKDKHVLLYDRKNPVCLQLKFCVLNRPGTIC